jgi:hypothetical protein
MKKRLIMLAMSLFVTVGAIASDNSIYIDQSGDNTSITVIQDGAGNTVRGIQGVGTSNTTPARITGNDNVVSVQQIGAGNRLDFGIRTSIAAGAQANSNTFNYKVTGNNATAIINSNADGLGTSASNKIDIDQTGNNANANVNILGTNNSYTAVTDGGSNNSVVTTVNGESNVQNISLTGGGANQITTTQNGNAGTMTVTGIGASNTFTLSQSGGSMNGHQATIHATGSSNTFSITQAGTSGDSVVNLKSVGSVRPRPQGKRPLINHCKVFWNARISRARPRILDVFLRDG